MWGAGWGAQIPHRVPKSPPCLSVLSHGALHGPIRGHRGLGGVPGEEEKGQRGRTPLVARLPWQRARGGDPAADLGWPRGRTRATPWGCRGGGYGVGRDVEGFACAWVRPGPVGLVPSPLPRVFSWAGLGLEVLAPVQAPASVLAKGGPEGEPGGGHYGVRGCWSRGASSFWGSCRAAKAKVWGHHVAGLFSAAPSARWQK